MVFPMVLDACCGSRMMWFNRMDARALFIDKRQETCLYATPGRSSIVVAPDLVADFTAMPFADESFHMVVFDPPHILGNHAGKRSHFRKLYGVLPNDWRALLALGFQECFRVLKKNGTLIFKWSEKNFPISTVLECTPFKPLFGNRNGMHTHWVIFMKDSTEQSDPLGDYQKLWDSQLQNNLCDGSCGRKPRALHVHGSPAQNKPESP